MRCGWTSTCKRLTREEHEWIQLKKCTTPLLEALDPLYHFHCVTLLTRKSVAKKIQQSWWQTIMKVLIHHVLFPFVKNHSNTPGRADVDHLKSNGLVLRYLHWVFEQYGYPRTSHPTRPSVVTVLTEEEEAILLQTLSTLRRQRSRIETDIHANSTRLMWYAVYVLLYVYRPTIDHHSIHLRDAWTHEWRQWSQCCRPHAADDSIRYSIIQWMQVSCCCLLTREIYEAKDEDKEETKDENIVTDMIMDDHHDHDDAVQADQAEKHDDAKQQHALHHHVHKHKEDSACLSSASSSSVWTTALLSVLPPPPTLETLSPIELDESSDETRRMAEQLSTYFHNHHSVTETMDATTTKPLHLAASTSSLSSVSSSVITVNDCKQQQSIQRLSQLFGSVFA